MRYGLIGKSLGHSFSPPIHHALADYSYDLFPLAEEEIEAYKVTGTIEPNRENNLTFYNKINELFIFTTNRGNSYGFQ